MKPQRKQATPSEVSICSSAAGKTQNAPIPKWSLVQQVARKCFREPLGPNKIPEDVDRHKSFLMYYRRNILCEKRLSCQRFTADPDFTCEHLLSTDAERTDEPTGRSASIICFFFLPQFVVTESVIRRKNRPPVRINNLIIGLRASGDRVQYM